MNEKPLKFLVIQHVVLQDLALTLTQKVVFSLLYNLDCTKEGCIASNRYIADYLGISVSSVKKHLMNLRDGGYIEEWYDEQFSGHGRHIRTIPDFIETEEGVQLFHGGHRNNSTGGVEIVPQHRKESLKESNKVNTMSCKQDEVAILDFLNQKTNRKFKPVKANLDLIALRLKEYSADELRQVIAKKSREWSKDEKMCGYLRPKTLFNSTNMANYSGELQ